MCKPATSPIRVLMLWWCNFSFWNGFDPEARARCTANLKGGGLGKRRRPKKDEGLSLGLSLCWKAFVLYQLDNKSGCGKEEPK